jgi:hypothetical protein
MDFFDLDSGTILTFNSEDVILTGGKKIEVEAFWGWGEGVSANNLKNEYSAR